MLQRKTVRGTAAANSGPLEMHRKTNGSPSLLLSLEDFTDVMTMQLHGMEGPNSSHKIRKRHCVSTCTRSKGRGSASWQSALFFAAAAVAVTAPGRSHAHAITALGAASALRMRSFRCGSMRQA